MPNDEEEQDRMDMQHHIFLLAFNGELSIAPHVKNPQKILDLGTGTGIWAIDAGEYVFFLSFFFFSHASLYGSPD